MRLPEIHPASAVSQHSIRAGRRFIISPPHKALSTKKSLAGRLKFQWMRMRAAIKLTERKAADRNRAALTRLPETEKKRTTEQYKRIWMPNKKMRAIRSLEKIADMTVIIAANPD
ncbi:MAG: hypothetical protein HZB82_09875 [Deltaproteobacteria bacterium]|nr:hypothetical protein [Deltaproteobacteria bacterium]